MFRATPWEGQTCSRPPTADEQTAYKAWIRRFAEAIGESRVAIMLQPDLPLALQCPETAGPTVQLTYFAAQTVQRAFPTSSIYLDAGAADWAKIDNMTALLAQSGIEFARGFTLNASHSDSTKAQVFYGAQLAQALAAKGYPDRHFVVNTAANGRPFTHTYYRQHYRAIYGNSAPQCQTTTQRRCVTLGIPPTTQVASRRWGFGPTARQLAAQYCDGYLWIGRPWINHEVLDLPRALDIARTTRVLTCTSGPVRQRDRDRPVAQRRRQPEPAAGQLAADGDRLGVRHAAQPLHAHTDGGDRRGRVGRQPDVDGAHAVGVGGQLVDQPLHDARAPR